MTMSRSGFLLLTLVCSALVSLIFLPGLPGDFVLDDTNNIVGNAGIELRSLDPADVLNATVSTQFGGATRVLPTMTFALDYFRGNGLDPATFKTTNIAIHVLTTFVLVWFFCTLLQLANAAPNRARWMALAMALAWAIHPLQVSSVLYAVQRMQTMATLFILLALWAYLKARKEQIEGRSGRTGWMLTLLLWVLAFGCKEDAVLLPAYLLALELTVLRFQAADAALARALKRGYLLLAALGAAVFLFVVVPHYWSWDAYPTRNFSSYERLLTQPRMLCLYLWQILLPMPSHMPFYYDWVQPSRGLLNPGTTLPSLFFLLALLGCAWHVRQRRPLFAFGVFLFFAGHLITSNVIGLELAFEHRNHLPMIGIVLAVGDLLALTASSLNLRTATRAFACIIILIAMSATTVFRARSWDSGLTLAQTSTRLAPVSARAWNSLCVTYFMLGGGEKANNPNLDKAIAACNVAADVGPDSIKSLTNIIAFKAIQGTVNDADWERYLLRLRQVAMTPDNASAIWVILNRARDGLPLNGDRVLEAIDIINHRQPFRPIESAAMGYFILGHTKQPERAYPYFAQAVRTATDPSFATGIIDDLRKEGHSQMATQLENQRLRQRPRPAGPT
jgi:hypothetical protein